MVSYNFKANHILNNISTVPENYKLDATDFITRANDTTMLVQNGIIESLYVIDNGVFAIIRKNTNSSFTPSNDQTDHGDGWFNGPDRTPIENVTVAELAVLTNIDASNNKLERYIGKECSVTVKNNVAVYAEVKLGYPSMTTITASVIRKARVALASKTEDIFSDVGKKYFKEQGITDEDIEALSNFKYLEDMTSKVNTFSGEALWFKDTSQATKDENIIEPNSIMLGLKKLGMKSKKCHIPTRVFSGK